MSFGTICHLPHFSFSSVRMYAGGSSCLVPGCIDMPRIIRIHKHQSSCTRTVCVIEVLYFLVVFPSFVFLPINGLRWQLLAPMLHVSILPLRIHKHQSSCTCMRYRGTLLSRSLSVFRLSSYKRAPLARTRYAIYTYWYLPGSLHELGQPSHCQRGGLAMPRSILRIWV